MKKSTLLVGGVAVSLCAAFAVYSLSQATAAAQKPADAQTIKVVTAAQAFLGTLTEAQKKTVSFAFTDTAQRARWSNFPQGAFNRVGRLLDAQVLAARRSGYTDQRL